MSWTRQDLLLIAGLCLAALLGGWLTAAFGWSFFVAAAVWAALQQREKQRLMRFARKPLRRPTNDLDSWQDIGYRVYRTLQQARRRNHATLGRLRSLRAIVDAVPDAAVITNTSGNILDFNKAAPALLQLSRADLGNHLPSLVRQPDLVALIRGQISEGLIEFNSPFDLSVRLEARRVDLDADEVMILVRDVTVLNRLLSMRQDFIANVSHELRTPLTVIVGYVEALLEEDLDAATRRKLIGKLTAPTSRMRALVDDLLLLTQLEASPNPARDELVPVGMRQLIAAIVPDARILSDGSHRFEVDVSSESLVVGVESELHSACLNLLTNAVRYSPDGGTISISWRDITGGSRFSISDEGIGIPKEHLARLTERFYRVDLAKSRIRGGTGLGLAIVKHVLKRHDSQLQVTSKLAHGSTFYFDFSDSQLSPSANNEELQCET